MSRSIDPLLRNFLQARAKEWLAQPDRTARELARVARVSTAQISDLVNGASAGWKTLQGLLPVFGLTLGTLEDEVRRWSSTQRSGSTPPPSRQGPPRLADRPEWTTVTAAVAADHGELDEEDVAAAGRIVDDGTVFFGPLDAPTISGLATVLGARRRRLARRIVKRP